MVKKLFLLPATLACIQFSSLAQTTYLQLGQEDYNTLDRLETRSGHLSDDLFLSTKPVSRKGEVKFLEEIKTQQNTIGLTSIDRYNLDHAISVSGEWASDENGAIDSKLPWLKTFYKKQPDFVYIKTPNFFLSMNPVLYGQGMYESANGTSTTRTLNTRGGEVRGWIGKKIGFYTYFTDNQENTPTFFTKWINTYHAVPGADYFQTPTTTKFDYLQARGYIDFAVIKDHINVTAGYDKHFYGDGFRSLFLSDFSAGATFMRINTKIWKLNYQNLFLELTPQYKRDGNDNLLPHKYATIHTLSLNATKWLNIGLFESVIFDRVGNYEFSYMVPIIFYREIERANGSPDNALVGLNFKALAAKHLQFYGQFLFDEFRFKELKAGNGWWANKFGIQVGGKYFDAFGVKNLDLQGEINIVRPFTYSHYDTIANYSHYNQPLAHPLSSGFGEIIGQIRYQPIKKLYLSVKGTYYTHGIDTGSSNYGNSLFMSNSIRTPIIGATDADHGYGLTNGVGTKCMLVNFNASYEIKENVFIDLGASNRALKYDNNYAPTEKSTYVYFGVRMNIVRRDYDQF